MSSAPTPAESDSKLAKNLGMARSMFIASRARRLNGILGDSQWLDFPDQGQILASYFFDMATLATGIESIKFQCTEKGEDMILPSSPEPTLISATTLAARIASKAIDVFEDGYGPDADFDQLSDKGKQNPLYLRHGFQTNLHVAMKQSVSIATERVIEGIILGR